ncbi:MAG: dynein gamma chain protein [Eggerthellaceae bacterium]|nr:dynein gamma chain protein [Eggerthellaceae bacterium]
MCTNGVNTGQFNMMLEQMDDQLAVNRRWVHKLAHTAGDAGFSQTDEALHKVQELLDDARALISDAKDALEKDAEEGSGVTVSLV